MFIGHGVEPRGLIGQLPTALPIEPTCASSVEVVRIGTVEVVVRNWRDLVGVVWAAITLAHADIPAAGVEATHVERPAVARNHHERDCLCFECSVWPLR